ncbi:alpha amylase, N-terminal Ig-like domain protein [Streptococcus ictaluri 707-05]|uniref:Alpha amylase, N-terminal Ig-like domain protein n=1 Tax=Streptococcus ictaluri 707-05 TaxID=764299 RepID=G5JZU6_9STRE|nr:alpha amylase N-terminal ig-like domain-containing protein [Streptococcus ictaluri]EHI70759.1 alpha amylase, N-terminal Ig-like domain protein [Streptococcus ictaluri 707-05]
MESLLTSIYSDSTSHYVSNPYPKRGDKISITIRLRVNDKIDKVFLRYKKQGVEIIETMSKQKVVNGLVYYQAQAHCLDQFLTYQFYLTTQDTIYFYTQAGLTTYLPDDSRNFKIFTDYDAPSWLSKTVFYQIMPDRFANGRPELTLKADAFTYNHKQPRLMNWDEAPLEYSEVSGMDFYGGDLWGIIDRLDYLQELDVNGIYLNPIFTSPTHHKYDALDYFEVDPSLGGEEALIALSKAMHDRDMRLILDISINHTSSSSKWFNKTCEFYDKS